MTARFGPAGNCDDFYEAGYKATVQAPQYVMEKGLDAYEVQFGHGVRMSQPTAEKLGENARKYGVALSIHAPYYISLASAEEQKRENSVGYILQTARVAKWCGATRIVVHPGGLGKLPRPDATALAAATLKKAVDALDAEGLGDIHLCPETMGKINQLGDLSEVITLCRVDERLLPTIDFGHLNARTHGGLGSEEAIERVFDEIENGLGRERMQRIHAHFSKIEYSKGGEVRHLTFEDEQFGPSFEQVLHVTLRKNAAPVFICESAGTQAPDALLMKQYYDRIRLK